MTSSFNEVRQTNAGITHYIWSTSHDERVRASHARLNGETFSWKDPPEVDGERANPGEPVNCRCVAIPVIDVSEVSPGGEALERQAA
jgi:SPP1 gp7 family putative phage head morphogenesis protein